MSRRTEIVMPDDEVLTFLEEERIVTCATLGRDGRPHLMPLWYVVREGTLWAWTYSKSQKVRNLRRDYRATLQVEAGGAVYAELRGVMIEANAMLHFDRDTVAAVGAELAERYAGLDAPPEAMQAQAAKRVAIEFEETSRVTWDHRKL